MKIIAGLLICFCVVNIGGCITIPDAKTIQENSYRGYSEVINFENLNQVEIFEASKMWMAKNFNSANNVIQYADVNTGTIIGKGNFSLKCPDEIKGMSCLAYTSTKAEFTLKIDIKDNKARLSFSDLKQAVNNYPFFEEESKQVVDAQIKDIIKDYKTGILSLQSEASW